LEAIEKKKNSRMSGGIERMHPFSVYKEVMGQGTVIFFYSLNVPSNFLKPFHFLKNFKNNLSHKKS
jgi:hypothetical protein